MPLVTSALLHERQHVKGWHAPELLAVLDQLAALVHLRDDAKLPARGAGKRAIVRSEAHVAGFLQGCRLWRLEQLLALEYLWRGE